jgi:hypothetical protein
MELRFAEGARAMKDIDSRSAPSGFRIPPPRRLRVPAPKTSSLGDAVTPRLGGSAPLGGSIEGPRHLFCPRARFPEAVWPHTQRIVRDRMVSVQG